MLIGDTLHDVEVAQTLGIDCLLIPSDHQAEAVLAAAGVPVLTKLADLLATDEDRHRIGDTIVI